MPDSPGAEPSVDQEVRQLKARLRQLEAALAQAREDNSGDETAAAAVRRERERLAKMLHDTLSQSLSGMQMMVAVLTRKLQTAAPQLSEELRDLEESVHRSSRELQDLMHSLRS